MWVFHGPWYGKQFVYQWQPSEESEALSWYYTTAFPILTWDTTSFSSPKGKIRYGKVKWLPLCCTSLGPCQEWQYHSAPLFLTAPSQGNLYEDLQGFPPMAKVFSSSKAGRPGRNNQRNAMHYSRACKQCGMRRLRRRRQQCLARRAPEQFRWPAGRDPHSKPRVTQQHQGGLSKALLCLLPFNRLVWPVESNATSRGHLREAVFLIKAEALLLEC